ncbi:uncharacterized protein BO80DRAFT_357678 [Aspergillus ibericus CBS 121593]|uniref:Uncharacterized protein n=1 Tax=Aspergillus ibericus CBS 121593 TaxID=1448316 RepID=A0A395GXZ5_9EURO|nr:hypothetical protein BO80DRAFT_357678 [Aspergillus ibericus CBS 121593]RAL00213.1 hypothetical protein BO80DRAFT_357678 [Aspergillus ibericus CBS 121593]
MELSTKRRTSFSFLFGSQKSTLVTQNQPTRYYDFVDTPEFYQPPSPLIERQQVPKELEAQIRNACTLLVCRVEQGVPSGGKKRARAVTTNTVMQESSMTAQVDSKYMLPKVGADVAALKDKFDSGVALTQQPSMQAMRTLHSQSKQQSKSDSLGSGRATSSHSAVTNATQSMSPPQSRRGMGHHIMSWGKRSRSRSCSQSRSQSTEAILDGFSEPVDEDSHPDILTEDNVEVFLDPDAAIMSSGVASFHSPQILTNSSPGLDTSGNSPSHCHSGVALETPTAIPSEYTDPMILDTLDAEFCKQQPGIIIDSSGLAHVLSAAEETQRAMHIQQAVRAKMKSGTITNVSTTALPACPDSVDETQNLRPGSNASRLKTSWSAMSKATSLKRKPRGDTSSEPTVFRKLVNFFSKRRPVNVVQPVGTY